MSAADVTIVTASPELLPGVLRLNEASVPHVNSLSLSDLETLAEAACSFRVAIHQKKVVGFLLALPTGISYDSLNYRWFSERYDDFVYIDRIAVDGRLQRAGIGQRLYADLFERTAEQAARWTCEVNIEPPNPVSTAFHTRLGFVEVGRQFTEQGTKQVRLLSKTR